MSAAAAFRDAIAEDSFELALAVDGAALAYERRVAGKLVHEPVDVRCLGAIAVSLPDLGSLDPGLSPLDRIRAIETRVKARPARQREELIQRLTEDRERVPWRPMRGSQALAYERANEVDVLLLAGGAASGKTEVALAVMLLQSRNARFLRKTSLEFQAPLKRIGEIVGSTEGRNLANQSWQLPAPFGYRQRGTMLEFSSLNDPDSMLRLQGRAVDTLVVDDAASGQITKDAIEFIARWLRSSEQVPKKMVLSANPPTSSESLWLRDDWFAPWLSPSYPNEPAVSGEVRHFIADPDKDGDIEVPAGTPGAQSRCVIRSTVFDNPRLLRTGYDKHLAQTPTTVLRKRLLDNDWTAGFDNDADLQVLPGAWVDAAMDRWTPEPPPDSLLDAIGADVARGGKDRSVVVDRYGDWFSAPVARSGADTADSRQLAALILERYQSGAIVFPDATGVGAALVDSLRSHPHVRMAPVVFGARYEALDNTQSFGFVNVRSALWWRLRELLDPSNLRRIALPPDRALKSELTAPRYELRGARLYVESRDDLVKRVGRSVDIATAVILAAIDANSTLAAPARGFRASLQRAGQQWLELNEGDNTCSI